MTKIYASPALRSLYSCYKAVEGHEGPDAYEAGDNSIAFEKENEPDYTNFTDGFKKTLDYILIENAEAKRAFPKLLCTAILKLPSKEQLTAQTALPNDVFGSDHVCLMAEIGVKR